MMLLIEGTQYTSWEEKDLVAESTAGDMQAFEELVVRHEKRIVAAAYRMCGNREEGEDMAQEAFIKAWRALPGYRGQAAFGTWLTAILTNLWRDRLRKPQLPQDSLDEAFEGEEGAIQKQFRDGGPGPEDAAVEQDVHAVLGGMLQELKPEFKEVLILRDIQGFGYEEVAVITGSNLGTVKSRINRARALMKTKILAYQEQNPAFFRLTQVTQAMQAAQEKHPLEKGEGGEPHEG